MTSLQQHWNTIFSSKAESDLGWYESDSSQTFKFLGPLKGIAPATVFIPGVGTSLLVDELLQKGHNLILNDISDDGLAKLKQRIGGNNDKVTWLHADIAKLLPEGMPLVDMWIDRAVLHFLLKEQEIACYFDNLRSTVKTGGYALLAQFLTGGTAKCAGLDLHLYSLEQMTERMGHDFECVQHEEFIYTTPFGAPRPYLYVLFRKK